MLPLLLMQGVDGTAAAADEVMMLMQGANEPGTTDPAADVDAADADADVDAADADGTDGADADGQWC